MTTTDRWHHATHNAMRAANIIPGYCSFGIYLKGQQTEEQPPTPVAYAYDLTGLFRHTTWPLHRRRPAKRLLNLELLQNYGAGMWLGHNKAEEGTEAAVASQVCVRECERVRD